jgi:hypothetical protein
MMRGISTIVISISQYECEVGRPRRSGFPVKSRLGLARLLPNGDPLFGEDSRHLRSPAECDPRHGNSLSL